MAQLNSMRRYGNSPKSPNSPTVEQLLHGEASWWPAATSPTSTSPVTASPRSGRAHDPEEYHLHPHKKSVYAKVKDRAKKLRHSLSKKRSSHDGNTTPSWGVSLDDDDDDDAEEDPEYFGAPMYESELAPEGYKETARQHPRAVRVVSEKHLLESNVKQGIDQGKNQKPPSPNTTKVVKYGIDQGKDQKPPSPNTTKVVKYGIDQGKDQKPPSPNTTKVVKPGTDLGKNQRLSSPNTTNVKHGIDLGKNQKLSSPNVTNVKHGIDLGKDQKLSSPNVTNIKNGIDLGKTKLPSPITTNFNHDIDQGKETSPTPKKTLTETASEKLAPAYATVSEATHTIASKLQGLAVSSQDEPPIGEHVTGGNQKWDKGVSVKEYLMHKFVPGEDERALSHAISEVMSPRRIPGDISVVEKVRDAVTSLLRNEESAPSTNTTKTTYSSKTTNSSSHIPISTNAHEAIEEENHGRILQAN